MDRWNDFNAKSEFYTGFIEKPKVQKVGHIIPLPTLQRTKLFLVFEHVDEPNETLTSERQYHQPWIKSNSNFELPWIIA